MSEVKTTLVTNTVENLPVLEEVPEGATLIAEVDGEFYRVKGEGTGGGIKTAIVKSSLYDAALAFVADPENATPPEGEQTYECINMTHAEAVEILKSGKPLDIQFLYSGDPLPLVTKAYLVVYLGAMDASESVDARDAIGIDWDMGSMAWTGAGFAFPDANAASETEE